MNVLLRTWSDLVLISVNEPIWGRSEEIQEGMNADAVGVPRAWLVIGKEASFSKCERC